MNNWIVDLNQKEQARGTALVFVPHAGGGPNAFRSGNVQSLAHFHSSIA